jgi:hypothetical protein
MLWGTNYNFHHSPRRSRNSVTIFAADAQQIDFIKVHEIKWEWEDWKDKVAVEGCKTGATACLAGGPGSIPGPGPTKD